MGDIANKDEGVRCLNIAQSAMLAGNLEKAEKFVDKAMRLYPTDQVRLLVSEIARRKANAASTSGGAGQAGPRGPNLRQRRPLSPRANGSHNARPEEPDTSTPEQKELVKKILKTKDFYELLGLSKGAGEDEIKRAYRKLAIKLHPDKNKAKGADEAFKMVSRAFSCLSDADKRAYYDRTGAEDSSALRQQHAARAGRTGGGFGGGGVGYDEFDPEEIFNMFFNGGFNPRARVFRTGFGGPGFGFQQQQAPREAAGQGRGNNTTASNPLGQLLHLIPIVILLLLTFFNSTSDPVYSLDPVSDYTQQVVTRRYSVPYYVRPGGQFEKDYPLGGRDRVRLEQQVELDYKDRLEKHCTQERLQQQRLYRWGHREQAQKMELPHCEEMQSRFGYRFSQFAY